MNPYRLHDLTGVILACAPGGLQPLVCALFLTYAFRWWGH